MGVRVQLHKTYNMMNNKDACTSHANKQNLIQVHKHKSVKE